MCVCVDNRIVTGNEKINDEFHCVDDDILIICDDVKQIYLF